MQGSALVRTGLGHLRLVSSGWWYRASEYVLQGLLASPAAKIPLVKPSLTFNHVAEVGDKSP